MIASTIISSPALLYAVDDTPLLQVTEQRLVLVEPTNGKPVVAKKTIVAPNPEREAGPGVAEAQTARLRNDPVDDGWVAREHIDQLAPLRDPVAITRPQPDTDSTPGSSQPNDSNSIDAPQSVAAPPATAAPWASAAPRASATPPATDMQLSPALEGLTPVPRMRSLPAQEQQPSQAIDEVFETQTPLPQRSIPIRRPDLTRGIDSADDRDDGSESLQSAESRPGPDAGRQDVGISAETSIPLASPAGSPKKPTGLGDFFREAPADNEGEVVANPLATEPVEDAPDDGAYVGDWDKDTWQDDHVAPSAKAAPKKKQLVVTPAVQRLRSPMETSLRYYYQRPEKAPERSSWGMLHSIMVYGVETQVIAGRQQYNAVAWLAGNNVCRGQRIFTVDRDGISPRSGVGLQGHQGQFLAVFGLIGVPDSYPLYVGKQKFSVADLVVREQANCRSGEELTFTLIGLSHYLDTDATWTASDGQPWDFERLIQEELSQQVIGAACGGTHRLMGLSHALRIRREQGRPLTGQWARADQFITDFVDYAWKLQNPDGSMSTDWFEGRGNRNDIDRKLQTTGHIVEWLIGVMPDEELQDPRMIRAISFLTNALYRNRNNDWEIGPKGHALRSLALYHDRVYGTPPPWRAAAVAQRQTGGHHHRSR